MKKVTLFVYPPGLMRECSLSVIFLSEIWKPHFRGGVWYNFRKITVGQLTHFLIHISALKLVNVMLNFISSCANTTDRAVLFESHLSLFIILQKNIFL